MILTKFISEFILPPGLFFVLLVAGMIVYRYRHSTGRRIIIGTLIIFYLVSTPFISYRIAALAETAPALNPETLSLDAQAIVVLGGGRRPGADEFATPLTVSNTTLSRVRYAAFLARRTGLPVLTTGGTVYGEGAPEAQLMADVLKREFSVDARWREEKSRNTEENAAFSAPILKDDGVRRVYLVTDALHMRRSARMFRDAGLEVIPAPTAFKSPPEPLPWILKITPNANALLRSQIAMHEIFGAWWYALRH